VTGALLDTNIVLDFLQARPPYVQEATIIWHAAQRGEFSGFVSAITPTTVFYIVRRERGGPAARLAVQRILTAVQVCPVDRVALRDALSLSFTDFEDAVQCASAEAAGLDLIVTRDVRDFRGAALPVLSPAEFIAQHLTA